MNKRYVILIMIVALTALAACGGKEEVEPTQEEIIEKEIEKRVAEEIEQQKDEQNVSDMQQGQKEGTKNELLERVYQELQDEFGEFSVGHSPDDNLFFILPTEDYFIQDLEGMVNGEIPITEWYDLVDDFTSISESISNTIGNSYSLALVNPDNVDDDPTNEENTFLLVEDGDVLHDMLEDTEEYSIAEVLDVVKADYQESADIHYTETTLRFSITPTDPHPKFAQDNGQIDEDNWYETVDNVSSISKFVTDMLGDHYSVVLLNPSNKENMLVLAQDGEVLYDVLIDAY